MWERYVRYVHKEQIKRSKVVTSSYRPLYTSNSSH